MPSFDLIGPALPESPVILSVPHAGRDYPPALLAALRAPAAALTVLEDRHVDAVAMAARTVETLLIQRRPRAWIDLNRAEDERDPQVDEGARPLPMAQRSIKVRSGLGLVPRRAGAAGDLWRRRFTDAETRARIADDYRPYHATLATALDAAHARFGAAILLDIHSMPPLPGASQPQIVIGDRFGRTASARLVGTIEGAARAAGLRVALNTPYAGAHLIERHARPRLGRHAIQLEIDRSLYLDASLDRPGDGLAATAALVRSIAQALAALPGIALPLAAE